MFGDEWGALADFLGGAGETVGQAAEVAAPVVDSFPGEALGSWAPAALGSMNPATFADSGPSGGVMDAGSPAPASPSPTASAPAAPGANFDPESNAASPYEQPHATEAMKPAGGWWQQFAKNAGNQIQQNPWRAAGYAAMGGMMGANAIQAGMQPQPKPYSQPQQTPSAAPPQTPLPPPGPGVSPILNQRNNGMNVKYSQGVR